jgi:hypothetical protein
MEGMVKGWAMGEEGVRAAGWVAVPHTYWLMSRRWVLPPLQDTAMHENMMLVISCSSVERPRQNSRRVIVDSHQLR